MKTIIACVTVAMLSFPAYAGGLIRCHSDNGKDVVISIGAKTAFKRNLDCISGDFIVDLTPCAPNGSFGLSAGTGDVALVGIVDRWQDYSNHIGGVTSHFVTPKKVGFSGGFNSPGSGYTSWWEFNLDKRTNVATLIKDAKTISYRCAPK